MSLATWLFFKTSRKRVRLMQRQRIVLLITAVRCYGSYLFIFLNSLGIFSLGLINLFVQEYSYWSIPFLIISSAWTFPSCFLWPIFNPSVYNIQTPIKTLEINAHCREHLQTSGLQIQRVKNPAEGFPFCSSSFRHAFPPCTEQV